MPPSVYLFQLPVEIFQFSVEMFILNLHIAFDLFKLGIDIALEFHDPGFQIVILIFNQLHGGRNTLIDPLHQRFHLLLKVSDDPLRLMTDAGQLVDLFVVLDEGIADGKRLDGLIEFVGHETT